MSRTIIINGIVYDVIEHGTTDPEHHELLFVRRPNGRKIYVAERLPDSPIYGENRGRILLDRR